MERFYTNSLIRSDNGKINGTASVYYNGNPGTEFTLMPGVKERIAAGAFDNVLRSGPDVVATFNHDMNMPLARTPDLKLWADQDGLQFELSLPPTTYGQDLAKLIDLGIVRGCSFAAQIGYSTWGKEGNDDVKTIRRFAELVDVSIVLRQAYGSAQLRSKLDDTLKDRDAWLDTFARLERVKALLALHS
jgi:hypothetical protein